MKHKLGDIVWVKVQGFPWWPGKVVDANPDKVPANVLDGKQPEDDTLVKFYSTSDE